MSHITEFNQKPVPMIDFFPFSLDCDTFVVIWF